MRPRWYPDTEYPLILACGAPTKHFRDPVVCSAGRPRPSFFFMKYDTFGAMLLEPSFCIKSVKFGALLLVPTFMITYDKFLIKYD